MNPGPASAAAAPLAGWRVVIVRSAERGGPMLEALTRQGAQAHALPLITFAPPSEPTLLDEALARASQGHYSWVILTSVTAVEALRARWPSPRFPSSTKIAAVGPSTRAAVQRWGVPVDLMPESDHSALGLLAAWPPAAEDRPVFLPRADIAAPTLPSVLASSGWQVDAVTAYRTLPLAPKGELPEQIRTGQVDALLFTSSSTVRTLVDLIGSPSERVIIGCIGSATAATARALGVRVDLIARTSTAAGLVEELADFARQQATTSAAIGEDGPHV